MKAGDFVLSYLEERGVFLSKTEMLVNLADIVDRYFAREAFAVDRASMGNTVDTILLLLDLAIHERGMVKFSEVVEDVFDEMSDEDEDEEEDFDDDGEFYSNGGNDD